MTAVATRVESVESVKVGPFVKWAGGKRELVPEIFAVSPPESGRYYEPFVGGGALYWAWDPVDAVLADANARLIRTYRAIRDNVEAVIAGLRVCRNDATFFELMRRSAIDDANDVQVAVWFLYLNRTCFNGIYRVNKAGEFNVPFAENRKAICADDRAALLRACSRRLASASLRIGDFEEAASDASKGDYVYFDPPYIPLNATANFASYTADGFGLEEHARLRDCARALASRGVHVVVSGSWCAATRALYSEPPFVIHEVSARRNVNSKASGRGAISEALIVAQPLKGRG